MLDDHVALLTGGLPGQRADSCPIVKMNALAAQLIHGLKGQLARQVEIGKARWVVESCIDCLEGEIHFEGLSVRAGVERYFESRNGDWVADSLCYGRWRTDVSDSWLMHSQYSCGQHPELNLQYVLDFADLAGELLEDSHFGLLPVS